MDGTPTLPPRALRSRTIRACKRGARSNMTNSTGLDYLVQNICFALTFEAVSMNGESQLVGVFVALDTIQLTDFVFSIKTMVILTPPGKR